MKPRILFLNRSYWPDAEATGQLLTDLTEDLADRFDVHVLAGQPNHIAGHNGEFSDVQSRNGVTIHRTRHSQFSKASKVGKLANLLSFTASAYWHLRRRIAPDLVVAQTDPFFLPLIASRMRRQGDCKMVVTLQDIYPDVMVGVGLLREGRTTQAIRKLLQSAYQRADRIVVSAGAGDCRTKNWPSFRTGPTPLKSVPPKRETGSVPGMDSMIRSWSCTRATWDMRICWNRYCTPRLVCGLDRRFSSSWSAKGCKKPDWNGWQANWDSRISGSCPIRRARNCRKA
jgi:hypothetical protein